MFGRNSSLYLLNCFNPVMGDSKIEKDGVTYYLNKPQTKEVSLFGYDQLTGATGKHDLSMSEINKQQG